MRERVVLVALSMSTFAFVTVETLPIGLLPLIARDLHSTASAVGLLVTAYGLVVVVATVPLTRLTQRLGRRGILCALMGVFVVTTALSALAHDYATLLAARMVTALGQALFWAVVTPATAALFPPHKRSAALAILYAGPPVAALLGVPAGTWLGQQTAWRVPFLALSAVGLAVLAVIGLLLPPAPPGASDADRGSAPDTGRYWTVVAYTALSVTGAFASFTYVTPFLTDVTGFGEGAVGPLLSLRGVTGLIAVFAAGYFVARNGWLTMTACVAVQAVAVAAQWAFATNPAVVLASLAVSGFGLSAYATALGARALEVAPGRSDMAAAGTSTAFNVGITGGALAGSLLLPVAGVRSTALAGALFLTAATLVAAAEPRLASRRRSYPVRRRRSTRR